MLLEKRDIQNHSTWESCPQAWASAASVPVGCCPGVGDNLHSHCADGSLWRRLIFFHLDFDLLWTVLPDIQKQSSIKLFEERIWTKPCIVLFFFFLHLRYFDICGCNNSCMLILLLSTRQSQFLLLVSSRTALGPQTNRGPHSCNISCGFCFLAFWGYILWTTWSYDEWRKYDGNDWQLEDD